MNIFVCNICMIDGFEKYDYDNLKFVIIIYLNIRKEFIYYKFLIILFSSFLM